MPGRQTQPQWQAVKAGHRQDNLGQPPETGNRADRLVGGAKRLDLRITSANTRRHTRRCRQGQNGTIGQQIV